MVFRGDDRALPCPQAQRLPDHQPGRRARGGRRSHRQLPARRCRCSSPSPRMPGCATSSSRRSPSRSIPRIAPGWTLPPVTDDDPLGIERCSHHTVLTGQPERALRLIVDVLGGNIVHEGRDELRGTTVTSVDLAGSILEYAVPDVGSPGPRGLGQRRPDTTRTTRSPGRWQTSNGRAPPPSPRRPDRDAIRRHPRH